MILMIVGMTTLMVIGRHHLNSVEFRRAVVGLIITILLRQWDDLASGFAKHNLACRLRGGDRIKINRQVGIPP